MQPGSRLEVENFNGSIEIAGWDQPRCEINGAKYASTPEMRDRIKIEISPSDNLIYIRSVRPPGDFHGNFGVRYTIHVPRKTELSRITSSNGLIHVEDTEGPAELKSSNGAVRVESLTGMLKVQTTNGSVNVQNVSGTLSLRTSNSAIRAEHVTSGIEATTSNGSITVDFAEKTPLTTTPLKFESTNGRIDITIPTQPKSEIRARTSNGGITLRLPSDASAKVRMSTSHGEVRSDFYSTDNQSGEQGRHGRHHRGESLEETIGDGGPLIDLTTSNGSIHLFKI